MDTHSMTDNNFSLNSEGDNAPPQRFQMPAMVMGRGGTRRYSMAALIEMVQDQFYSEHADITHLPEYRDKAHGALVKLVMEAANYVFAVESVELSRDDRAQIIAQAYSEIFGYGPLDKLFADETITTISIAGATHTSVRYGQGELTPLGQLFDDSAHLQRVIGRLLDDAGAQLREDTPIIETGLIVGNRRIAMSVAAPPLTIALNADIRLHTASPSLADLIQSEFMTDEAAAFIEQVVHSQYGFSVVGEPESGKTTLLNALVRLLPNQESCVVVERAGEFALPDGMRRLRATWPVDDDPGVSFGLQIEVALRERPACIVLDEVRADEPLTIAPLLETADAPRQVWSVRGVPDAKRLQSAMGMLARRASFGQGEALVHALYQRLPFVFTVARIRERLQLFSIAEWQSRVDSDYPDYVMLFQYRDGASRPTERTPARWLE